MSHPDPLTMTLDELTNWFAIRKGWCRCKYALGWHRGRNGKPGKCDCNLIAASLVPTHDVLPTLDGASAAMPEGVRWERSLCPTLHRWEWRAYVQVSEQDSTGIYTLWRPVHFNGWPIAIPDTNDPKTDLYRLAVACCMAEDERRDQEVKP